MDEESYVQIVGAECAQCTKRMVSLVEGAPCSTCGAVVHVDDACWEQHWNAAHAAPGDYRKGAPPPPPPKALIARNDRFTPTQVRFSDVCPGCRNEVFDARGTTLGGFRRFYCSECNGTVLLPLTSGRKLLYIIAVVFSGLFTLLMLLNGRLAFPGLLAFAAGYSLIKNQQLEQSLRIARSVEPEAPVVRTKRKRSRKS